MKITSNLFQAYLKCPTKCWLLSQGEVPTGNTYADWLRAQKESYRSEGVRRLLGNFRQNEIVIALPEPVNLKAGNWRMAVDMLARAHSLESRFDAVERVQFGDEGRPDQFLPICFVFTKKITQDDKLTLAFDTLILSETLGREITLGKIIYGEKYIITKINTLHLVDKVRKQIQRAAQLLSTNSPPDLVLKRYCAECEFKINCRQVAFEKDDLSLLACMTGNERNLNRSKGIFTVNQLSYTFRPRRTPKRAKNSTTKHYPALQALAIRENTVFIHGSPNYPESKTQIYLDVEGLPDHDSYYLIGALVVSDGHEKFHSLWANNESEEPAIFSEFIDLISAMPDYRILHYGDYEKLALRKMKLKLPENLHQKIDEILDHSINLLSLVHSHFYFPTYSNSLKDIGTFLGYEWFNPGVSGLSAIIWRTDWNQSKDEKTKSQLTLYNEDDCKALKLLSDFISHSKDPDKLTDNGLPKTSLTQKMFNTRARWRPYNRKYAIEDLEHVSRCAYFDYQREKVFVRTNPHIKALKKKAQKNRRKGVNRPNKIVNIELKRCVRCRSRKIQKIKEMSHDLVDLKFGKGGIRKCITHFVSWKYICTKCHKEFNSEERFSNPQKYGHGLASWCVYLNNVCGLSILRIAKLFRDIFRMAIQEQTVRRSQQYIMKQYRSLYDEILQRLLSEAVIHVDETTVKLKPLQNGYVWVLTSMDKVYYFYRPTRETSFLKEMLAPFNGILISDFYTGYDSLPCEQQKCLIHLIRDIGDGILRNPLDNELKVMAREFGILLRSIVSTIDKYGLKRRHLQKHKKEACRFLRQISLTEYFSESAVKLKKRFEKNGSKMFTFLDHDGVPWNNNNAEHAIKRFARRRTFTNGMYSENTLKAYLVLATVFETCEFNNINVFQFLLSKINTLEGLLQMARRKVRSRKSVPILAETQAVLANADSKGSRNRI